MADDNPPTIIDLNSWRSGDDDAFHRLHARLTPVLRLRLKRHSSWSVLKGQLDAEDVLQEFWAKSFRSARDEFRHLGEGSLLGYLGKLLDCRVTDLARHHSANKRGSGKVEQLPEPFEPSQLLPGRSVAESPSSHARANEDLEATRQALSPDEFEVWYLKEVEGWSYDEIALGSPRTASALRGLYARGRARIIKARSQSDQ